MSKILDLYKAQKSTLGVDKISFDAGVSAKTPYTTNDLKKIDKQILTATKFKSGRGGNLNNKKYSTSLTRK